MSLRLCLACHHPLIYHTATGCTELIFPDDPGEPEICPCDRPGWGTDG